MRFNLKSETIKFILVGFFNTFHYYLWYLLFTEVLNLYYLAGHWLAFLISMVGSFYLNTYFTYRSKPSWRKFFQFPLTYVVNITVSTSALYLLKEWLKFDNKFAPILAAAAAIPFTFIISRKILKTRRENIS
ncbi:GtrA family protein [Bacillus sp. FJAT-29790]|uniref:GtrA family protein n=1 Tax=Bacillus sp. FJAT-29790 TaxID=1895002 RepID=UPI001C247780|nr:GtrA family protein [Bacillus sp. FJAT-29790]MBU8881131.1 GtrA family protein [Bacillus sp. FJAT-29790]